MPLMARQVLGIAFFLAFVWVADWAVAHAGVPVPAAVAAMAVMTLGLAFQKRVPRTLDDGAQLLFRHFPLFFIPALTSIVSVADRAAEAWLALVFAITVSTLFGLLITVLIYRVFSRKNEAGQ